jgi:hypothetical protein
VHENGWMSANDYYWIEGEHVVDRKMKGYGRQMWMVMKC